MSHKWRRNKKWEDEHLTGPLTPIRVVLRLFETIPLAIVLLVFISLYATLASVPIGMIGRTRTGVSSVTKTASTRVIVS